MSKYFAAAVPILGAAVYLVQVYYLRTSRQIRLLDIESRAPLFTHFLETINGAATIRAFGWPSHFQRRTYRLLNNAQNPFYLLLCIQQWLTLVLNFMVGAVAVMLVAITVNTKSKFSPGVIGVILNLVLTFNESLIFLVRAWVLLETSIGAVTRVKKFVAETPSEKQTQAPPPPPGWPSRGNVEILNVSVASQ
jgi:ABC-type multidrug transport system fused ATPase/permease subunit